MDLKNLVCERRLDANNPESNPVVGYFEKIISLGFTCRMGTLLIRQVTVSFSRRGEFCGVNYGSYFLSLTSFNPSMFHCTE
jgi:hypothetical protein